MPDQPFSPTPAPVASWRRYIILGGIAVVAIGGSVAMVLRRPANPANQNGQINTTNETGQNTITGRPTFERFQASTNSPGTNTPAVSPPTLEQTQQAIKELQQQ